MIKRIIIYNNKLFASPGHLMNYFRKHDVHQNIDVKYLTQCIYKGITNVKGVSLSYRDYDLNDATAHALYVRIKSLTRSGEGYKLGMTTPLDYFNSDIRHLIKKQEDPIKAAIDKAIKNGIGTEKDYEDLIKEYQEVYGENK